MAFASDDGVFAFLLVEIAWSLRKSLIWSQAL
jgi:hypothetical protein